MTGTKQWAVFCRHARWKILLIDPSDEFPLSHLRKKQIEFKLCCFAAWLYKARPPLASGTISAYVGHVRSQHSVWLDGEAFNVLLGATSRLTKVFKAITKIRPKQLRKKVAFTILLIQKYYDANKSRIHSSSYDTFADTRNFALICIAFYQLCRMSELANMNPPSQANAYPILLSDVKFFAADHSQIPWPHRSSFTGKFWQRVDYIRMRFPPSKADPFSYNSDIFFPRPSPEEQYVSAFTAVKLLISLYPMRQDFAQVMPLLRQKISFPCDQVKVSTFWGGFKAGCRRAEIKYSVFGTHCFRVAGMNRLGELNAGPVIISAHGHWASDAWADYGRRNQQVLMKWVNKMAGAPSDSDYKYQ
jgi:hypothetical protein